MAVDGSISQAELDKLMGLEPLEKLQVEEHVWLIKSKDNQRLFGGRCFSYFEAQNLLQQASKSYPGVELYIKQVK